MKERERSRTFVVNLVVLMCVSICHSAMQDLPYLLASLVVCMHLYFTMYLLTDEGHDRHHYVDG